MRKKKEHDLTFWKNQYIKKSYECVKLRKIYSELKSENVKLRKKLRRMYDNFTYKKIDKKEKQGELVD